MTEKEPYLPPQGQLSGDVYRAMTDYYFPKKVGLPSPNAIHY